MTEEDLRLRKHEAFNDSFTVPDNIAKYATMFHSNVAYNFNVTDGLNGYGILCHRSVVVSRLTRTCNRCGYDSLWNPDDMDSKCGRHTYGNVRYDPVFVWSETGNPLPLEEAFDDFLKDQPGPDEIKPAKFKQYGIIGYQ